MKYGPCGRQERKGLGKCTVVQLGRSGANLQPQEAGMNSVHRHVFSLPLRLCLGGCGYSSSITGIYTQPKWSVLCYYGRRRKGVLNEFHFCVSYIGMDMRPFFTFYDTEKGGGEEEI